MTCIHYYSVIQDITVPTDHLGSAYSFLPRPSPLVTTDPFTVSVGLPFPECHIIGLILCVAFSDWLLSLRNMHLSFLHVFSWFDSSFLFSAE